MRNGEVKGKRKVGVREGGKGPRVGGVIGRGGKGKRGRGKIVQVEQEYCRRRISDEKHIAYSSFIVSFKTKYRSFGMSEGFTTHSTLE